jgi:hypothetical protein
MVAVRRLAVAAAACMVAMTVSCSSAVNKPVAPETSEPQPKPELTQVTTSMFVDRSAVPNSSAMEFTAPDISSDMQEQAGSPCRRCPVGLSQRASLRTELTAQGSSAFAVVASARAFTQQPVGDLSPNDTDALVKLFNDQVAKLEAI